eukprot:g50920.t1
MEAVLTASGAGQHHVLTDFVARYEGKELSFYKKSLGDSGAYAVAKGLQVNSTLTALDIGRNVIGPQGAQSIADAIKRSRRINVLLTCTSDTNML